MFDDYRIRLSKHGGSNREYILNSSRQTKEVLFDDSIAYKQVLIDGVSYDARIITDVADTVKNGNGNYAIEFRDKVLFYPGTYIQIENVFGELDYWLLMDIIEDPFSTYSLIKKCNFELKWKNNDGNIVSRWITFDDSYKLYAAIRNYGYKTNLSESNMAILLPYDHETIQLGLDDRLMIDNFEKNDTPDVYKVSNRSVVSRLYNHSHGVIKLSLTQTQFNHTMDNAELMVADYYTETEELHNHKMEDIPILSERHLVIKYKGQSRIVMGTGFKEFNLEFTDNIGNILSDVGRWQVNILPEFNPFFNYEINGNTLRIKADFNENLESYKFKIIGSSDDGSLVADIMVKVVSGV